MKKAIFLALFGVAALCAPAQAQVTYDMSKVVCADYNAMDPTTAQDFSAWMAGWFNQRRLDTVVNLEGYRKNVANVQAWCQSNPKANIMSGLETAVQRAKPGVPGPTDIDVSQITCGEFLKSSDDDQLLIGSWTGGWFMSTKNLTVIDPRYVRQNSRKAIAYCKSHKTAKLMNALQKTWR